MGQNVKVQDTAEGEIIILNTIEHLRGYEHDTTRCASCELGKIRKAWEDEHVQR